MRFPLVFVDFWCGISAGAIAGIVVIHLKSLSEQLFCSRVSFSLVRRHMVASSGAYGVRVAGRAGNLPKGELCFGGPRRRDMVRGEVTCI